ncbi:MAG: hypothetical protein KF878_18115 [Planctomycetes bacterium]|nr:hypothetical protein [Planctomycetota bacterium]
MGAPATTQEITLGERRIEAYAARLGPKAFTALFAGALLVALCALKPAWRERLEASYLVAFCFFLSITLGALFFVVIQHLVKAGWSVVVRRVAEGLSLNVGLCLVLFLPLLGMTGALYPWAHWAHGDHAPAAHDTPPTPHVGPGGTPHDRQHSPGVEAAPGVLTQSSPDGRAIQAELVHPHPSPSKHTYLSFPFFAVRLGLYFVIWWLIANYFWAKSVAQDAVGGIELTNRMQWWSPAAMIAFAITCALSGFDLLMTMDPGWYSTMFGVYWFAGCAVSAMASLVLCLFALQRQGLIKEVTPEHYHDVGKLMFAFVVFWAYIAFSQFMLIWYGNIPEEVGWYQRRVTGGWLGVSVWLLLGHFVIPFLCMISRYPKRRPGLLALGAMWVLFVHYVDLMWLVLPQPEDFLAELGRGPRRSPVPLLDLGFFLALGGLFVWNTARNLKGASLIPERDPRLRDSLHHENF